MYAMGGSLGKDSSSIVREMWRMDLNDRNCMWGIDPLHNLSRADKYKILGRPLKRVLSCEGIWKPEELVKPLVVPETLRTESFYLGDFGQAMKVGSSMTQPKGCPPAIFACDMWSYMCIFAELYLGFVPFTEWRKGGVVTSMIETLGPLPEQWKGSYIDSEISRDMWYDQNTKPRFENPLAAIMERVHPESDPAERHQILSLS
ncbi:hypothetical protein AJ80_07307 [Polytolypa hystricis UAMH7299]|uniref:Protein kinase domain-containing protein n=1 Tax=Polytolypa hystricis (strain UAMH7299) TaxID=1447883 RepID=A0A2B7XQI6_POLH7|nr:hypothetical protein AJ80_07307 [Polytolypa hystricis UAMH7299]